MPKERQSASLARDCILPQRSRYEVIYNSVDYPLSSPTPFLRLRSLQPALPPMKAMPHGLWFGVRVHPDFPSYLHPQGLGAALSAPTDRNFCAVGSDGVDKCPLANRRGSHCLSAPAQAVLITQWGSCWRGAGGSYLQGRPSLCDGVAGLRPEGSAQSGDKPSGHFCLVGCL